MKKYILEDKLSGKFFVGEKNAFTSNEMLASPLTREQADLKQCDLLIKGITTWILPYKPKTI